MAKPKQATRGRSNVSNINWRWWLSAFFLVTFIFAASWGWFALRAPQRFPIHTVVVEGQYQKLSKSDLEASIAPLAQGNFFTIKMHAITDQLLKMPWVASATVRRVWPDKIVITVTEQQPVAVWNGVSLMNAQAQVFTPPKSTWPQGLPVFNGPSNNEALFLGSYKEINTLLTPLKLQVVELDLSPTMSWSMVLSNGLTVVIGNIDPLKRLERFVKAYPQIFNASTASATRVDLRYTNGIAVQWNNKSK